MGAEIELRSWMGGKTVKGCIVTTTINPLTEAIARFDALSEWDLIVVGDRKTPEPYHLDRGLYLSCDDQEKIDRTLSDLIGWDCIQRRNMGFVLAWRMGAEVVATVDDDNIPLPGWGEDLLLQRPVEVNVFQTDLPAFDPVGATDHPELWHRGYPLQLVGQREYDVVARELIQADIQADFWNGDPDIDAVCRMLYRPECTFEPSRFPIASNAMSPFDSQNTFVSRQWLPEYFLPPGIGRMDDIWASYHLQAQGGRVVYGSPSVYQRRNPHDPISDLKLEYLGYERSLELVQALAHDPGALRRFIPERAVRAFERYQMLLR